MAANQTQPEETSHCARIEHMIRLVAARGSRNRKVVVPDQAGIVYGFGEQTNATEKPLGKTLGMESVTRLVSFGKE